MAKAKEVDELQRVFAENLRRIREGRGHTRTSLAKASGVHWRKVTAALDVRASSLLARPGDPEYVTVVLEPTIERAAAVLHEHFKTKKKAEIAAIPN